SPGYLFTRFLFLKMNGKKRPSVIKPRQCQRNRYSHLIVLHHHFIHPEFLPKKKPKHFAPRMTKVLRFCLSSVAILN
ncbi:hypothetical protein, partial [Klebsiella grimontii]|uniref:hypothetical protein n=1 Tax=Klebsiella grimontii TaxID=2058152 RepID=UPI001D0F3DE9